MRTSILLIALASTLVAPVLHAQLQLRISPDPKRIEPGTTLNFGAKVGLPVPGLPSGPHTLKGCTALNGAHCVNEFWSADPSSAAAQTNHVALAFPAYVVPGTVRSGDQLCFLLQQNLKPPYGSKPMVIPVGSTCVKVSVLNAVAGNTPGKVASVSPAGQNTSAGSAGRGPPTAAAAAPQTPVRTPGFYVDLTVQFEKAPVAKWIVRNVGTAASPATIMRLARVGVAGYKDIAIQGLKPSQSLVVVVTPELDGFLVNSSATIDPLGTVTESSKTNNVWQSFQSR